MLIQGTSITIMYKRIEGIKKAYYNNENILKEFFNEATVLPVPDEAPDEIPRILIKTLNEHAQLNISPIATTFEIFYNDGFERDWKACASYIFKRMEKIFEFLNMLTNNNYEYIGLVTRIIFDDIKNDGSKQLADVLLKTDKIKKIHDINIQYTFVENNDIFVNIMLENARVFNDNVNGNIAGELCNDNQQAELIGIVIDVNDRYGFNNNANYKSDSGKLKDLVDCMTNIIKNKIYNLVKKGEY